MDSVISSTAASLEHATKDDPRALSENNLSMPSRSASVSCSASSMTGSCVSATDNVEFVNSDNSFSNLSLTSQQNILISEPQKSLSPLHEDDNHNDVQSVDEKCVITSGPGSINSNGTTTNKENQANPHDTVSVNESESQLQNVGPPPQLIAMDDDGDGGNKRRSTRIENKRKRGHVDFYTPKSWKIYYDTLNQDSKRQKLNNGTANSRKKAAAVKKDSDDDDDDVWEPTQQQRKKKKPSKARTKTKATAARTNTHTKTSEAVKQKEKKQTAAQLLSAVNKQMRAESDRVYKLRLTWLKHHFDVFEPFLSPRVKRKLKPSAREDLTLQETTPYPCQPTALRAGQLRDYQLLSVNWARNLRDNGVPAILADEMGLGKTIQSVAMVASLYQDADAAGIGDSQMMMAPTLVVAPLSVVEAWCSEFEKWMPNLRVVLFHGPKLQLTTMMRDVMVMGQFQICVTTYEVATNYKGYLAKFYWQYLILDEGHRIKNETTHWHHAMRNLYARSLHCVMLTGTPIQNNMHELYALLSFMFNNLENRGLVVFDEQSASIFDSAYDSSTNKQDKALLSKTAYLLQPFFLRRLKSEVELSLPPKEEIIVKIKMCAQQRNYYKGLLAAHAALIDEVSNILHHGDRNKARNTVTDWKKLKHLYVELRKVSLHPFLLANMQHRIHAQNGAAILNHSSKLQLLDKLLTRLHANGHRVLLFSCFTMVLDLLEVYCEHKKYRYLRLDGSTSRIRRKIDIMRFNDDPNSPFFIYLISNRAGGLGINLQSADTVVHFDTDWNPQADLQAQARAHRIGQKNMVKIYRIITSGTVEERILFRSQQKLYLDAVVNKGAKLLQDAMADDAGESEAEQFDLTNDDLLHSIKFGADKLFDSTQNGIDDEIDLDILLQRSYKITSSSSNVKHESEKDSTSTTTPMTTTKKEPDGQNEERKQRQQMLKDLSSENNVRDFNFSQALQSGNVFEGQEYKKKSWSMAEQSLGGKRACSSAKYQQHVVDGLRFTSRVEQDTNHKFYKAASDYVFDSKSTQPFSHELERCWSCDQSFTSKDRRIVECAQCPKTFHHNKQCWRGTVATLGTLVCSQHSCYHCGLKTSECGMILRCLACQESYCLQCAPSPHWKSATGDGLHFVDHCTVAQHHNYRLSASTYMYVLCGAQCYDFYHTDYVRRSLPDLSLTEEDLPEELLARMENRHVRAQKLKHIRLDKRVIAQLSSFSSMSKIVQKLQCLSSDSLMIKELYHALYYPFDGDEDQEQANAGHEEAEEAKEEEKKEDKAYVRSKHYLKVDALNQAVSAKLTLPQWIQCTPCRQWRLIQVNVEDIISGQWTKRPEFVNWKCCVEHGFENGCASSKQATPTNEREMNILRLQREGMNVQLMIAQEQENARQLQAQLLQQERARQLQALTTQAPLYSMQPIVVPESQLLVQQKSKLSHIEHKLKRILKAYKTENIMQLCEISVAQIAEARFIGITEWSGFDYSNDDDGKTTFCRFYEHLIATFREWRNESLKTILDHLGFFVVTRKKMSNSKQFKVDQVSLSYQKEKVIEALAVFLTFPCPEALEYTTAFFAR